jgi:hypothetical protein
MLLTNGYGRVDVGGTAIRRPLGERGEIKVCALVE